MTTEFNLKPCQIKVILWHLLETSKMGVLLGHGSVLIIGFGFGFSLKVQVAG